MALTAAAKCGHVEVVNRLLDCKEVKVDWKDKVQMGKFVLPCFPLLLSHF